MEGNNLIQAKRMQPNIEGQINCDYAANAGSTFSKEIDMKGSRQHQATTVMQNATGGRI